MSWSGLTRHTGDNISSCETTRTTTPTYRTPPRRAGSLADPHRGTVFDVSRDAIAHDRHDEGAARRQELDPPPPLDARGNLAERVRATFTADAEGAAGAGDLYGGCGRGSGRGCGCGGGGGSPSWTCRRARRGEVNAHPSGARAAADETIRARPRSRAASSASAQRRAQTSWARSRRRRADTRAAKAPRAKEPGAGRPSSEVLRGRRAVCARACGHTL